MRSRIIATSSWKTGAAYPPSTPQNSPGRSSLVLRLESASRLSSTHVSFAFTNSRFCSQHFLTSGLAVRNLVTRRTSHTTQSKGNSALTTPRLIRLLILCPFMGIWPGLVVCFILLLNFRDDIRPWIGWNAVHRNFSEVVQKPASEQNPSLRWTSMVVYWIYIINALVFAAILLSGEDVRNTYRAAWDSLSDRMSWWTPRSPQVKCAGRRRWFYSAAHNESTILPPAVSNHNLPREEC